MVAAVKRDARLAETPRPAAAKSDSQEETFLRTLAFIEPQRPSPCSHTPR